jgi:hypothetical protein
VVKQDSFKGGKGVYSVTIDEAKGVTYAAVSDAIGSFTLDQIEIVLIGDAEKTDKGMMLTARGSKSKFSLVNREKKKDEKEAPKVVEKIEELLKDGKTIKVTGWLKADKDKNQVIHLESAEALKP